MHFKNLVLESIDYDIPEVIWTSDEIERKLSPLYDRLKLPYGRLELMTGIAERRFWEKNFKPSQASAKAGEKVLKRSQWDKKDIDMIIHAGVCRDCLEPSTASYVHRLLGLSHNTQILDVSNACLGFMNAILLAGGLIESGQIRNALIVSGENGRPLIENTIRRLLEPHLSRHDIKPFFANLTIGSAAVAAVVCHKDFVKGGSPQFPSIPQFLFASVETDTSMNHLCEGNATSDNGLEMETDAEQLLVAGVEVAKCAWKKLKQLTQWNEATPNRIICHQVGKQHRIKVYESLQMDLSKDFSVFHKLGNVGSAALPIALAMAVEENAIQANDEVALLGIGSGLCSIMIAMQW